MKLKNQLGQGMGKILNDKDVNKNLLFPQLRETVNSQGRETSKHKENFQMPVEETFYKSFGKVEKPFGEFNQNYK